MLVATATRIIATPQSPWTAILATAGTIVGVCLAYLGLRLARRQARQSEKDRAGALETKRQEQMDTVVALLVKVTDTLFGHTEGNTKFLGVAEVIVGDGNGKGTIRDRIGNVEHQQLAIVGMVTAVQSTAGAATDDLADMTRTLGQTLHTIDEHVEDDKKIHAKTTEQLTAVLEALETINGLPIGRLSERREGDHIEATVAEADRTPQQQIYVDKAHDDAMGHEPKDTP